MSVPLISICIPTYNRATHLANCLNSIKIATTETQENIEVCISDNASDDNTRVVVENCGLEIPVRYQCNQENIGIPKNFLNVVQMANGEFAWLVGDDDLLLPDTFKRLIQLITSNPTVDFFYVNAFHQTTEFILTHPQPFDTSNLPIDMDHFSSFRQDGVRPFLSLIDPNISFDFLGGMFLSVFRRKNWIEHSNILSDKAMDSKVLFSHFDNTFPHLKIFAHAFCNSTAYFNSSPMIVCLTGAREWAPLYSMIKCVRLIEATILFKNQGLPFWNYFRCRNYTLRTYWPNLCWMLLNFRISGLQYLFKAPSSFTNVFFPNFYFSLPYYVVRKLSQIFNTAWFK